MMQETVSREKPVNPLDNLLVKEEISKFNCTVTLFERVFKPNTPVNRKLSKILSAIQEGNWKEQVTQIVDFVKNNPTESLSRKEKKQIHDEKQKLKETLLPVVAFTGEFTHRNNKSIVSHNGLMIIDWDDFETEEDLNHFLRVKKEHSDTYVIFKSPSGKGAKELVKIPVLDVSNIETASELYKRYFFGFRKKWNQYKQQFDVSGSDIARLCYVCYDGDMHENELAPIFENPISNEDLAQLEKDKAAEKSKAKKHFDSPERMLKTLKDIFSIPDNYDVETLKDALIDYFKEQYSGQVPLGSKAIENKITDTLLLDWEMLSKNSDGTMFLNESFNLDDALIKEIDLNPIKHFVEKTEYMDDGFDDQTKYDRIKKFNFNTSYVSGERNTFIVSIAGLCCEYGVSEDFAIQNIIADFTSNDSEASKNKSRITSIYKSRNFGSKSFKRKQSQERIKLVEKDISYTKFWFWEDPFRGKGDPICKIDQARLLAFLEENGYFTTYKKGEDKARIIRVEGNIVSTSSADRINHFLIEFCDQKYIEFEEEELSVVKAKIISHPRLSTETFYKKLKPIEINPIRGDRRTNYRFYNNGVVVETADGYSLKSYTDVDFMIWKDQIIDHKFTYTEERETSYLRFLKRVSGGDIKPFISALGYLATTFQDPSNPTAIVLYDEAISNDESQGGVGKELMLKAIEQIWPVKRLQGRTWNPTDSFAYHGVNELTQMIRVDDARKNFPFDKLFSEITSGISVNNKSGTKFELEYEESPKWSFTSNFPLKGNDESSIRRRFELELKLYYSASYRPINDSEVGENIWTDWKDDYKKWNAFHNFMSWCVCEYLKKGFVKQESTNIKEKKLRATTHFKFVDWAKANLSETYKFYPNISARDSFMTYAELEDVDEYGKDTLHPKKFSRWTSEYANYMDFEKRPDKAHGSRGFYLYPKKTKEEEQKEKEGNVRHIIDYSTDNFKDTNSEDLPF